MNLRIAWAVWGSPKQTEKIPTSQPTNQSSLQTQDSNQYARSSRVLMHSTLSYMPSSKWFYFEAKLLSCYCLPNTMHGTCITCLSCGCDKIHNRSTIRMEELVLVPSSWWPCMQHSLFMFLQTRKQRGWARSRVKLKWENWHFPFPKWLQLLSSWHETSQHTNIWQTSFSAVKSFGVL